LAGGPGTFNPVIPGVAIGGAHAGGNAIPLAVTGWDALVAEAALQEHSIAHALDQNHGASAWVEVARVLEGTAMRAVNVNVPNLITEYASALTTQYFLTVIDRKIEVLHAVRACFAVAGGGARVFGLVGERIVRSTGLEIQPKLYTLAGQTGVQATDGFERVSVAAVTLADMRTAFAADEALDFLQPLPGDPQNPPNAVSAFKTMPIHPRLACLFMNGVRIRAGVELILRILQAAPPEVQNRMGELAAFGRVAATAKTDGTSAMASTWRVMTLTSEPLEQWYYALLEREVPRAPATLPNPPPPATMPNGPFAGEPAARHQGDQTSALVTIMETFMKSRDSDKARGKDYPTHDREKLYMLSGMPKPWHGLGEESLSHFFKEFKPFRSSAMRARNFLESHFKTSYPTHNRDSYPFTWSSELVRALREMDFGAGDDLCRWADRAKGISFFSIAPSDEFGDGMENRAEMLAYENTVGHHSPADAQRMAALSATMAQIPSNRLGVRAWVDHADIWLSVHFSASCTALEALRDILKYLRNPAKFSQYRVANYRALIWKIHRALRSFFGDGDAAPLEFIAYQLKVDSVITTEGLPSEMRAPTGVIDTASGGTDVSSLSQSRTQDRSRKRGVPPGLLQQQDARRQTHTQPVCCAPLQVDVQRARKACEPAYLKGNQLAEGGNGIRALFGAEFCDLVEDGKAPCLKLFIMGKCEFQDCRNGHKLIRTPSTTVMTGVQARVKAACDKIVQHPKA
jgi:hypothetical protein